MNKEVEKASSSIPVELFVKELVNNDLGPVVEVPCSYLKHFLNYLWDSSEIPVINPANEAIAMAIAAGEYLGSGKTPVVAIQNSGFMNTLNALTSLNQIYDIPTFMMVTWRGEGGRGADAPEHDIPGENLIQYLQTFDVPFEITDPERYGLQIADLAEKARETRKPVAMIIKKDTFAEYDFEKATGEALEMTRMDAIDEIKRQLQSAEETVFLSGTGFPSRDSFNASDTPDFYTMGSMGHVFGIGLGVSNQNPGKKVVVLDGDGGALMHSGAFASLDSKVNKNLAYVMLDNGVYESTGGQVSVSNNVDFKKFAEAFGFGAYINVKTKKELIESTQVLIKEGNGPLFMRVEVRQGGHAGARVSDKYSAEEITERFRRQLKK